MIKTKRNIAIAVTGASGAIYASRLFDKLLSDEIQDQLQEIAVVFSENAKEIWEHELGNDDFRKLPFKVFEQQDFSAPFASGSAGYDTVIICPCSMGTMGRIANGISDDLIGRMADVALKERKRLIMVLRETPYNLIHIENMKTLTMNGAIICPATPSFYSHPKSINELVDTVIYRILDLANIWNNSFRWSNDKQLGINN